MFFPHFFLLSSLSLTRVREQWTVWAPTAAPLLSPRYYEGSLDPTFQFRHVGERWTATLRPGEVIFVPANAPHHALNVTDTVAVSANFIDGAFMFFFLFPFSFFSR